MTRTRAEGAKNKMCHIGKWMDGWMRRTKPTATPFCRIVPRSHQNFRRFAAIKLLGIMLRNRCWPTTICIITAGDVDGWYWNWPM